LNGIWKYSGLLPIVADDKQLTLGEGNTPLVKSRYIGPSLGLDNLFFKLENLNPSGSYKDRFAAMAVSRMLEKGNKICLATSSGNTGAALAAYCAAAGIPCVMAIVDGAPSGKLQQMQLYGAATLMVKDFGKRPETTEQIMTLLQTQGEELGTQVQISAFCYCPEGMQGVQTIAYEIADMLGEPADVFVPAGGGGLTLAIARGFSSWEDNRHTSWNSSVHCVQPAGNDTIVSALSAGKVIANPVPVSQTLISGLQVPNVLDGDEVITACRRSGGMGFAVSDEQVFACQDWLAKKEGIYCEPAGAVALAGVREATAKGGIDKSRPVVCIVTGHGFKDPDSTGQLAAKSVNAYLGSSEALKNYIIQLIR